MRRRGFLAAALAAGLVRPAEAAPRPFGRGSWRALLDAHAGRPTIIHFWGVTCGPCMVELPDWGKLIRSRPGIDLVLIAADPVPQPPDDLAVTLARAGLAGVESWCFDGRFSDHLYFEVDHEWEGELPRTTLRSANGQEETWLGVTDFQKLTGWLDQQRG